jgi:gas vesicle protein
MSTGKVLLGALAGFAAGAVLGILLAPDKGEETRKKMGKKADDFSDGLKSKLNGVIESVMEKFEAVKEEASDMIEKGKAEFNKVKKSGDTAMNN